MSAADADVVVLGAGINGLTAAIVLARAGLSVLVLEAAAEVGGAVRTQALTLPGFRHDRFSGFYPLFPVGPIGQLGLERFGLQFCNFARPYGGATPGGPGVAIGATLTDSLGSFAAAHPGDERGWAELWGSWQWARDALLAVLCNPLGDPRMVLCLALRGRTPMRALEFAQMTLSSAGALAERCFGGEDARVWLVGSTLHSDLQPGSAAGAAFALLLSGLSQELGMPFPRGGAQAIPDAQRRALEAAGGSVRTGERVSRVVVRRGRAVAVQTANGEFAARSAIVSTLHPRQLMLDLVGEEHLPAGFVAGVRRFRSGSGTFKLDCALGGLPRFTSAAVQGTGVLHLGESLDTLSRSAAAVESGMLPAHPLLIVGFHTLADPSRAPAGCHTLWAETHVPTRVRADQAGVMTETDWEQLRQPFAERMLAELERYAPGASSLVRGIHAQTPLDLEAANSTLVAGDLAGGSMTLDQQLVFRPVPGWFRHRTPLAGLYMCGASTHPGAGVHGAPGANAARVLLGDLRLERGRTAVQRAAHRLLGAG